MAKYDRAFLRARARGAYKKFVKENPQYKAMTFKSFFDLYKAGMLKPSNVQMKPRSEGITTANMPVSSTEDNELLDDILLEDIEEDGEDSDPE